MLFRRGHQVVTDVVETKPTGTTHELEVPLSSIGDPSGFKFIAFLPGENNPSGPYAEMDKLDLVPNGGFGQIGTPAAPGTPGGGPGGHTGTTDTVAPKLNFVGARKTQDVDKLGLTLLLDEIADVTVTGSVGVPGASGAPSQRRPSASLAPNSLFRDLLGGCTRSNTQEARKLASCYLRPFFTGSSAVTLA